MARNVVSACHFGGLPTYRNTRGRNRRYRVWVISELRGARRKVVNCEGKCEASSDWPAPVMQTRRLSTSN